MHHQSVKRVGEGLVVSAVAPDGVVEAVEAEGDRFMVGVQWHPEVFEVHDPVHAAPLPRLHALGAGVRAGGVSERTR
jgi:gamma-glutamyl-gamma-aminobutyrate hydrolase PuuD